ncbi:MAG: tetraacyldisaccharide 4'-kinase [Candidatus Omnitrophota bacterium]
MSSYLERIITGKNNMITAHIIRFFLWLLSCIYVLIVVILKWCHDIGFFITFKADHPVISIGNITVGGVGKTPLVIFLAGILQSKGKRPVILTRGYMVGVDTRSDEADMMAERLPGVPVMVNSDRISSLKKAKSRLSPDVFILDDGFQHWRLQRDLDIVAIDATNPFSNGHVLPRGLLREPLQALKRADLFILTKTDLGGANVPFILETLRRVNRGCPVIETIHAPVGILDVLKGIRYRDFSLIKDRVAGVCALGSPGSFQAILAREGAMIEKMYCFEDHYNYTLKDANMIAEFCYQKKINKVVTTHKDAVKIKNFSKAFQGISLLVLEIEIKVTDGKNELLSRLDSLWYS